MTVCELYMTSPRERHVFELNKYILKLYSGEYSLFFKLEETNHNKKISQYILDISRVEFCDEYIT